jgi:hypothetical protein
MVVRGYRDARSTLAQEGLFPAPAEPDPEKELIHVR